MKNRKKNKIIFSGLLMGISLFVMSCTRIELESYPGSGPVNIVFNWANLRQGDVSPTAMQLYFYGSDGKVESGTSDGVGFSGTLPNGIYKVLAYNTDETGATFVNPDSYETAQMRVSPLTKAQSIDLTQPLHAYGIGLGSITVKGDSVVNETMKPVSFVKSITVKYTVTGDKDAVLSCKGELDGIAQSVSVATGDPLDDAGAVTFAPVKTSTGYESTITFLGRISSSTNMLRSTFSFVGGGAQQVDVNITNALTDINIAVIPIRIDANIEITGTTDGSGSFHARLKSWTVTNEDVVVE